jgi:solute carrier family 10 (sodium/bile acid cotransporter), member 7
MTIGWFARHWFVLGLVSAAAAAFAWPDAGARGGLLRTEVTAKVAVALIFLMLGLAISTAALRQGAARWRLHLVMQLFMFVAFPAVVLAVDRVAGAALPPDLRLGFLFLSILPTTVSTCVVLTAISGGNVSAALFNSVLANSSGVVLTPLLAAMVLQVQGEAPPVLPAITEIGTLILAPLAAGQVLRPLLLRWGEPNARALSAASNVVILFIIYAAFANSVHSGAFAQTGLLQTLGVGAGVLLLFGSATAAAILLGHRLHFDEGDRRALFFCAPQKTLAAGVPMGQILFEGHPGIGLVLLPLMVYHVVQLLIGAPVAQYMRDRDEQRTA